MENLYNYLFSPQFSQKIRTMLDGFESMRNDLESEKRVILKNWAKREAQIECVTGSMVSVVGELQAIAHDALPEVNAMLEQTADPRSLAEGAIAVPCS